jgi:hypothetical protein
MDQLAHEGLGLEGRMRRDFPFSRGRRGGPNDVAERLIIRNPAQSAGVPFAQIVLDAALARLAEQPPRLPGGARHDRDPAELRVRVLRPVAAAQGPDQANDLAALFEPVLHQRRIDKMREQWIGGDEDVAAGNEDPHGVFGKSCKERAQRRTIGAVQDRETGQGASFAAAEGRRNPPNAAAPLAQLLFLDVAVLLQPVGRVGDDRVDGIGLAG